MEKIICKLLGLTPPLRYRDLKSTNVEFYIGTTELENKPSLMFVLYVLNPIIIIDDEIPFLHYRLKFDFNRQARFIRQYKREYDFPHGGNTLDDLMNEQINNEAFISSLK